MSRRRGLFILDEDALQMIYGPQELRDLEASIDFVASPQTRKTIADNPGLLRDVECIFSGWGAPTVNAQFLNSAPQLKAIFYGAGSTGYFLTEHAWERGVVVTSASAANAVPVAEYTLAAIIFSLKHGWSLMCQARRERTFPDRNGAPGCYGSIVGLVSLGITARTLLKFLRPFDLKVIAYDPFVTPEEAAALGVELVTLDEIFQRSHVVSIHTPLLTETHGMITGAHISSMRQGAALINTARGPIIREAEMLRVLARRPDLHAVLDVTATEPPPSSSPLYSLRNVMLTPHIAGSVGAECRRMGRYMVEELHRYLAGEPLRWQITRDQIAWTSHRPSDYRPISVDLQPVNVLIPS